MKINSEYSILITSEYWHKNESARKPQSFGVRLMILSGPSWILKSHDCYRKMTLQDSHESALEVPEREFSQILPSLSARETPQATSISDTNKPLLRPGYSDYIINYRHCRPPMRHGIYQMRCDYLSWKLICPINYMVSHRN